MTDQEILNELCDIRSHWERGLEAAEKRCRECREQIQKNTRLITLLEEKMRNKEE